MDIFYTHEKLLAAAALMVDESRPNCERLYDAYLELHVLAPNDFPNPLDAKFRSFVDEIHRHKGANHHYQKGGQPPDPSNHPLAHLSEEECLTLLSDIQSLEQDVRRRKESQIQGWQDRK